MTLIAGLRCRDGFLLAADTAVTVGNTVYNGDKLSLYRSDGESQYKLLIACAGHLTYARMASQQIRDAVSTLSFPTIISVKDQIQKVLSNIYTQHIHKYWEMSDPGAPGFSLIIAIEIDKKFEVLITENTALEEVGTYAFQGAGSELAQYLGEIYLRNRVSSSALSISVAAAVHLVTEIFRVVKLYVPGVGFDTQIIAYRAEDSIVPFSMPAASFVGMQSHIGIIQESLKNTLWHAFERSSAPNPMFDTTLQNINNSLRAIQEHTNSQGHIAVYFIRYSLRPTTGEWSMEDLEPNAGG